MTWIVSEFVYWLSIVIAFLVVGFSSSWLLSKWFKKKEIKITRQVESFAAFFLVILFCLIFVAFQERFVTNAYQDDAVITENEVDFVTQTNVKVISTEHALRLYDLYVIPQREVMRYNEENLEIYIETVDFTGLFQQAGEHDELRQSDNSFDFSGYYALILEPAIIAALDQGFDEFEQLEQQLNQQFDYHRFSIANLSD